MSEPLDLDTMTERRAEFIYEVARLEAIASRRPIIPEAWPRRAEDFRTQFVQTIARLCADESKRRKNEATMLEDILRGRKEQQPKSNPMSNCDKHGINEIEAAGCAACAWQASAAAAEWRARAEKAEAKLRESEAIIQDYLAMSSNAVQELCARAEKAEARVRELERAKLEER